MQRAAAPEGVEDRLSMTPARSRNTYCSQARDSTRSASNASSGKPRLPESRGGSGFPRNSPSTYSRRNPSPEGGRKCTGRGNRMSPSCNDKSKTSSNSGCSGLQVARSKSPSSKHAEEGSSRSSNWHRDTHYNGSSSSAPCNSNSSRIMHPFDHTMRSSRYPEATSRYPGGSSRYPGGSSNVGRYAVGRSNVGRYAVGSSNAGRYVEGSSNVGRYAEGRSNFSRYPEGSSSVSRYAQVRSSRYPEGRSNVGRYPEGSSHVSRYPEGRSHVSRYPERKCSPARRVESINKYGGDSVRDSAGGLNASRRPNADGRSGYAASNSKSRALRDSDLVDCRTAGRGSSGRFYEVSASSNSRNAYIIRGRAAAYGSRSPCERHGEGARWRVSGGGWREGSKQTDGFQRRNPSSLDRYRSISRSISRERSDRQCSLERRAQRGEARDAECAHAERHGRGGQSALVIAGAGAEALLTGRVSAAATEVSADENRQRREAAAAAAAVAAAEDAAAREAAAAAAEEEAVVAAADAEAAAAACGSLAYERRRSLSISPSPAV
ncbi:hypothetical protein cyc_06811 [Cyclospora cayetanensis]|uniref:Uncharacterized protein n=1 Tax=Cyclospora cayetanensis TaxID=88456 RepID=A0A1D3CXS9_9EIME|nr:hypothetical protein cyc_06811 [Cyclospora cayetanensis]